MMAGTIFIDRSNRDKAVQSLQDAARQIRGLRSDAIEAVLGYSDRPELIHRNDLVLR